MPNALLLAAASVYWYFSAIKLGGLLILIPTIGTLCLIAGLAIMIWKRTWRVAWLALSLLLSEILVFASGIWRGQLQHCNPVLLAFLILQGAVLLYLIFRLKGARLSAAPLAVFAFSFALMTAGMAEMSFADNWL